MKRILLATTALCLIAAPASAGPVIGIALAVGAATVGLGAASAVIAGTAIVWTSLLATAAVNGILAGVSALGSSKVTGSSSASADQITLSSIQPVTEGLILYGERMLGGSITARSASRAGGKEFGRYNSVMPLACHEIEGVEEIWVADVLVWTKAQYDTDAAANTKEAKYWGQIESTYKGKVGFIVRTGGDNQLAVSDYVNADPNWTDAAQGRGIAYVYFEYDYGPLFGSGPPAIRCRTKGKKVWDPRIGQTVYTANPGLCTRDYILTPEEFGGVGWDAQDLDEDSLLALANLSDEAIALDAGSTHARYEFNGVLDTASTPRENLNRLASSWGGWAEDDRGQFSVGGGAYEPSSLSITEDMMTGPVSYSARLPFEDQANVIKGIYADKDNQFTATDLPVLSSDTFKAEDAGKRLTRDLGELYGETDAVRGQRLQKLSLLKGRRQKTAEIPCTLAAWSVRLGTTCDVTLPHRGWNAKEFEVVGWKAEISAANPGVVLSVIETNEAVFDWTTSEETPMVGGTPSTMPSVYDPPEVDVPTVSEELYGSRGGGGIKVKAILRAGAENPFITDWQFGYYPSTGDADEAIIFPITRDPAFEIIDIAPGPYIFGARATNTRGVTGEWSWTNVVSILGLGAAPEVITGLTLQANGGLAALKWQSHPSLDVRQGGLITFRHTPSETGATWQNSRSIGEAIAGSQTETTLPLLRGTYLARAYDAQGIAGPTSEVVTRAASTAGLSVVDSITSDPTFGGSKVGCSVATSTLVIDAGETLGEFYPNIIIDLGAVQDCRLVGRIMMSVSRRSSLFWDRAGQSFWQRGGDLFWVSSGAAGDVLLYVSETDDDPLASPSWSAWKILDAAEVNARAFRFRAVLTVQDASYIVTVSELSVTAYQ